MALKRIILELGTGNDLHGGDYTKAALRAVQDALHHSSLAFIRTLGLDIRFVVTSFARGSAEWIYDSLYCARGQAENLIKLHKMNRPGIVGGPNS